MGDDKLTWREERLIRNLSANVRRTPFADLLSTKFQKFLLRQMKADDIYGIFSVAK